MEKTASEFERTLLDVLGGDEVLFREIQEFYGSRLMHVQDDVPPEASRRGARRRNRPDRCVRLA